jgi:GR25 family glycosyltransferase involved in LPS biosynthesis
MIPNFPIYCINLLERTDRKIHVHNEFNKLGIDVSNVKFPNFTRHEKGGLYGCTDSHVKIWKDFYLNSESEYCLVTEDDFVSCNNGQYILEKGSEFMQNNYKDIDFLFLHNVFFKKNEIINNTDTNILKNDLFTKAFGFCTHIYFISKNYIKNLIDKYEYDWMLPDGVEIDVCININRKHKLYSNKCFYTKNETFTQLLIWNSQSDLIMSFDDLLLRFPLYINFIQMTVNLKLLFTDEDSGKDNLLEEIKKYKLQK